MKKGLKIVGVILFCFIFIADADAFNKKIFGMFNLSRYKVAPEVYMGIDWDTGMLFRNQIQDKTGFGAGVGIEFALTRYLSLEIDALFFQKGTKMKVYRDGQLAVNLQYRLNVASMPVLLKVKIRPGSSPYLTTGFDLSYILNHRVVKQYYFSYIEGWEYKKPITIDMLNQTKRFDFSWVMGGGFETRIKRLEVFIEARYFFGLVNILTEGYRPTSIKTRSGLVLIGFRL